MKQSAWFRLFKSKVRESTTKSNGHPYKREQPDLKELKRTGRGNCVAWSLLMKEIANQFGLTIFLLVIRKAKTDKRHQMSVVIEPHGTMHIQSCTSIRKLWIVIDGQEDRETLIQKLTVCAEQYGWGKDTIVEDITRVRNGRSSKIFETIVVSVVLRQITRREKCEQSETPVPMGRRVQKTS